MPITAFNGKKPKLVPHDTGVARQDAAVRCQGSNRLVNIDVRVTAWEKRLETGGTEANACRSARQHYKPLPAPARPITKMASESANAEDALTAYREHIKTCRSSKVIGRCGGTHRCTRGAQLAALYAQLKRSQPTRDHEARVDALLARHRTSRVWTEQSEGVVDREATAKRSGAPIEEVNNSCRRHPAEAVSEFRSPEVPLAPVRINTNASSRRSC
ncbi:hypothetical protein [Streptomyces flavofungini]|uniref:hypothetical protein n=1 Tax=Streptomyces flavofungini TaxID=68200 RepID=UPI0025AFB17A|nr:hypothetical protein [Streptomyces flavofungini]WJV51773.1 hypothetical protein QUY26_39795 [Streptomyces flavofungini]